MLNLQLCPALTVAILLSILCTSGLKYRKPILKGKVKDVLRTIINGICYDIRLNMLALEIMPDHLHLFVGARPTHHPADIVKRLKGNTSIQLRRCFIHP
jgi:putative transposase